jgi:phenylacetate-CoA ligase
MGYVTRALADVTQRAYNRYRFYLYWLAQERMARSRSAEELGAMQWKKFRRLLEFAYDRIPLYKDKFRQARVTPDAVKTRDDLARIPILTKDEIRQNFPDRLVNSSRKYPPSMMGHTSSSTGESLHFVRPDRKWQRTLHYSVLLRMRRPRNVPVLVLTTPVCMGQSCSLNEEGDDDGSKARKLHRIWFLRHLAPVVELPSSASILTASDQYMDRLLKASSAYPGCIMMVDPVYLGALARYLKRTGKAAPAVRSIITSYEVLTGSLRDLLTEVFGCYIYVQYGSSEVNDIANECDCHRLHIRSSHVLVEAIADGRPARPGEVGRAVLTDLSNYNMPFVRYDVGDVISLGDGHCLCGRNTETIESVHGRARDTIRANGGAGVVTALQADEVFRGLPGIAAYQLVERPGNLLKVSIMPDGTSRSVDNQVLTARCRSVFGRNVQVQSELVEEIRPQPSMKFRFVWSDVSDGGV